MPACPRRLLPLLALVGCAPFAFPGAPPARDRHEGPLPPGAAARLGTLRWRQPLDQGWLARVQLSADGKWACSYSGSGVRVWDVATGKVVDWTPSLRDAGAALLCPDGKTLLTESAPAPPADQPLKRRMLGRWQVGTGEFLGEIDLGDGWGSGQFFSPDGRWLVRCDGEHIRCFDAQKGSRVCSLASPAGPWRCAALSADTTRLLGVTRRDRLVLFDVPGGKMLRELDRAEDEGLDAPTFAPDGRTVVAGGARGLYCWSTQTGKVLHRLKTHRGPAAFSPDGKLLACLGTAAIHLLDARSQEVVRVFEPHDHARVLHLAYSADGKTLILGGASAVSLWDARTGKPRSASPGHHTGVSALAFSADGKRLASGGHGGTTFVWDVARRRVVHRLRGELAVGALAFSPDGSLLAVGEESRVRLWDLRTGRMARELDGRLRGAHRLLFSPDGKLLAAGGKDDHARLWEVSSGKQRGQIGPLKTPRPAAFLREGRSLVLSDVYGRGGVWDVATLRQTAVLDPGKSTLGWRDAAYSPQARHLVSVLGDQAQTHDLLSGELIATVGLSAAVNGPGALSPDASTLACPSYSRYQDLALVDVRTGNHLGTLSGHAGNVSALAFSPDSRWLASGSDDTTVLIWDADWGRMGWVVSAVLSGKFDRRAVAGREEQAARHLLGLLAPAARAEVEARRLFVLLDDDDFAARQKASHDLVRLGPDVLFALEAAAEEPLSLEVRLRVRAALRKLPKARGPVLDLGGVRRVLAGLATLETPAARKGLEELARGDAGLALTRAAGEALRQRK